MRKINKFRFIEAIKKTKTPEWSFGCCLLCPIAEKTAVDDGNCIPCPLAREEGQSGCYHAGDILDCPRNKKEYDRVGYYKRTIIKMLEETPARYFTEKDWCYFRKVHEYIDKKYHKIFDNLTEGSG